MVVHRQTLWCIRAPSVTRRLLIGLRIQSITINGYGARANMSKNNSNSLIRILCAWRDSNSQESVSCSAGLSNRYVSPIPPQTHIILYPHRNSNPDTWCLRPIRLPVTSWGHLYFCIPGQIRTGTLAV